MGGAEAATSSPSNKQDPLSIPLDGFAESLNVNTVSALAAALEAAKSFATLPASASRTFIYTGNVLNVAILPKFLSQGVGKSGAAHMIWAASAAYKDRGYK